MARPYKYEFPAKTELVALLEEKGSINATANALDIAPGSLRKYVLKLGIEGYTDIKTGRKVTTCYPENEALIASIIRTGSLKDAAKSFDINYSALRHYVQNDEKLYRDIELAREEYRERKALGKVTYKRKSFLRLDKTTQEYILLLKNDPCSYCGTYNKGKMTIDHIVPLSEGGADHWTNMTSACSWCNNSKGTRSLLEFFLHLRG